MDDVAAIVGLRALRYECRIALLVATKSAIAPERPAANLFFRPYEAEFIPQIRTSNSGRLRDLVRAGKLYLTAQDAIALALENNIDIESARYNPLILAAQVRRAEAGGALAGVPSARSQSGSVQSGQGVAGSQAAAGVSTSGNSQQTGPRTQPSPRLDRLRRRLTRFFRTCRPIATNRRHNRTRVKARF